MKKNNKSKIRAEGFSLMVRIPACIVHQCHLKAETPVTVDVIDGEIRITPGSDE